MASPNYTYTQLQQLWLNAGGSPALAPLAAGIALVESSGNPNAYNPSGASGLWQIEIPINAGHVPGGAANVYNPQDNAAAAVSLSGNSLKGLTSNWLAFEPPGAAQAIAKANGNTPPATGTVQGIQGNVPGVSSPGAIPSGAVSDSLSAFPLPTDTLSLGAATQAAAVSLSSPAGGTSGTGGTGGTSGTSSTGGANNSPAVTIGGFPVPGFGTVSQAAGTAASAASGISGFLTIGSRIAKDFNTLVGLFNSVLADIEWLFVP